jgi:hypothetical protein
VDYGADILVAGESIFEVAQGGLFVSAKEPSLPETTKREGLQPQEQKKSEVEQEKTLKAKILKALKGLSEIIKNAFTYIWKKTARKK